MTRTDPSRRLVIGGLSTGLLAAAGGAQAAPDAGSAAPPLPMQDPTSQYPRPPFRLQEQPWPGLAGKMDPRPDHGETSYKGSGRLAGRKALVTGGDSGVGRAAVIAFAREGADVAFNYLPAEQPDADEVVELIRASGRKAVPLPGDITSESFCRKLVDDAARELSGLDILVNNAARQITFRNFTDMTSEQFDEIFKTNIYATYWITKAALDHLKPGAAIINTTSRQAYDPSPQIIAYASSKAAILNFTKGLAKQLVSQGIRVNAVAPGPFWTPLQPSGGQLPEELPQFGADTPMGRPGQPAELGSVFVLLASQESSYATGEVYGAVGGSGAP